MAKEVGRRLDEKLEGVLETSLPRLKARAEKYSSSGSGSGGEPSENDDLNFGDLNVSYKINHDIDDVNEDFQVAFN